MWRNSLNLLRFRHVLQSCSQSSSLAKEITDKFKLSESVLPSPEFLSRLDDVKQGKVARIIAELEAIYKVIDEVPKKITDQHWEFMLAKTFQIYDREDYLRQVYQQELSGEQIRLENERREKLLQEQTEQFERGEMVYGRGFYEYCLIVGKDFRRLLDASYGNRLRIHEQLNDNFPQFFVDCSYIPNLNQVLLGKTLDDFQRVHELNWTSQVPYPITFTNYLADERIAEAAKNLLHFQYGPPSKTMPDSANQTIEEEPFVPAAYAPRLTSRDFCSILPSNVQNDEVTYITQASNTDLDNETLKRSKILVFHAFPEYALHKSNRLGMFKKLRESNIKFYRLPLDANVKCVDAHKSFPVSRTISIVRDMLTGNYEWKDAILKHVPKNSFISRDEAIKHRNAERMQIYVRPSWELSSAQKELLDNPPNERPLEPARVKPEKRVHRYSREERNRRRREEAAASI